MSECRWVQHTSSDRQIRLKRQNKRRENRVSRCVCPWGERAQFIYVSWRAWQARGVRKKHGTGGSAGQSFWGCGLLLLLLYHYTTIHNIIWTWFWGLCPRKPATSPGVILLVKNLPRPGVLFCQVRSMRVPRMNPPPPDSPVVSSDQCMAQDVGQSRVKLGKDTRYGLGRAGFANQTRGLTSFVFLASPLFFLRTMYVQVHYSS